MLRFLKKRLEKVAGLREDVAGSCDSFSARATAILWVITSLAGWTACILLAATLAK